MTYLWRVLCCAVVAAAWPVAARADVSADVKAATGARTRIVWCRDAGDGSDAFARGNSLQLMGFDSHDGAGVRTILSAKANYSRPMMTPAGDRVVFSDLAKGKVKVVNFDGSGLRVVTGGFAVAVWRAREGTEWVYVKTARADTDAPIRRYRIDDPGKGELVWDKSPTDVDNFQLSADGKRAGGLFPWPECGVAELPNRSWQKFGRGCWTSFAPDNSYVAWSFDGAHRNLTLFAPPARRLAKVNISSAPGIGGYEVYHPRWSNHVRFLTMTGPYKAGRGKNRIRGGGRAVEIHLGRFNERLTAVEKWVRITYDAKADFYPDAWIAPGPGPYRNAYVAPEAPAPTTSQAPRKGPPQRVVLAGRLVSATPVPEPKSILPYRRALVVFAYEVGKVSLGKCPHKKVLVAHWGIADGKTQPIARRKVGESFRLALERFDDHPTLESERLIMQADELDLPLYYDVGQ